MKTLKLMNLLPGRGRRTACSNETTGNATMRVTPRMSTGKTRERLDYCLGLTRKRLGNGSTMTRVWRYTAMLLMLLTLGVGQMWGDPWVCRSTAGGKIATKTVGDKLNGGSTWNYTYTTNGGWSAATDIQVYVGTSTSSYTSVNAGWVSDGDGSNKNVAANIGNVTFDKSGLWYAVGKYKSGSTTAYTTTNSTWTNNTTFSMGSNSEPYWQVNPPAVSSFTVTPSGDGYVSGSGTEDDPYIMNCAGGNMTLTLSGSKAKTDANSRLEYKSGSSSWNTTTTRTVNSVSATTTAASLTLKMRCYNTSASLSGEENSITIWYKKENSGSVTVSVTPSAGGSASRTPTTMGYYSGGTITATENTGYDFTRWDVTTGSGTIGSATTASTTFKPSTSSANVRATFTAKTINVTLNGNGGTGGSATVKYDASSLTSISHASWAGHSLTGYWTADSGGDKVLDADGTLNNVSEWVTGGYWKKATNGTLYAQWTEDVTNYTVTYDVHSSGYGSLSAANTSTSAAISSGASVVSGTGITFTASPDTGYEVDGWFSNSTCTTPILGAGAGNTYTTSLSGDLEVYVKFKEKTWSVAFAAGTGGSVTTPNTTPKTVGQVTGISIEATPSSGYTFNTWTISSGSGSFTSSATTNSNKFKPTAESTITASFTETMRTITIVGGVVYGGSATSTTAGVATTAKITANTPAAGKKFTGWSLGDGVSLADDYELTDQTIEINATANATVTATYADRAGVKMYFAKPTAQNWSTVYAYAWKSDNASIRNAAYPGVELATTEVINNIVYYVYQYYTEADGIGGAATGNSAWNRVVFGDNNDARKTGDLAIADGHYYYKNSTSTGNTTAIEHAWYLKGSMNSWGTTNPITHNRSTNTGTVTINLEKGTQYEFKICDVLGGNEMWTNNSALKNITNSVDATTLYPLATDNKSMYITPNKTGAYVFTITKTNTTAPEIAIQYPSQYLVGSWDSWDEDDHPFDANGYVRVNLTSANTEYQFQVKYNGTWYGASGAGKITSTIKDWDFYASSGASYNVTIKTGAAGYYVFGWNGKDKKISVIYPADTTKAQLAPGKYIYFDARNLTAAGWWKDKFSTRFWLKNYASGVDITHVDCDISDTIENKVFYALVPTEGQVGQVHLNRMKPDFTANWNEANKVHAVDRANTNQNCLKEETSKEGSFTGWTPQWTTYCPPMSSATLSDNSTAKISWQDAGNDGSTSGKAILVSTSGTIKVKGEATKALNDANMIINYDFKVDGSSAQAGASSTYDKGSLSNNTTYTITMQAYNTYNGATGKKKTAGQTLYYKALNIYSVTNSLTNMSSDGRSGTDADAAYQLAYTATLSANTGYSLPTTITVKRGGTTLTAGTHYTYNSSTGALSINATQVTGNITITAEGVAKTYTASNNLDKNTGDSHGQYTATYDATTIAIGTTPAKTGYHVDGYYGESGNTNRVADADGALKPSVTVNAVEYTNSSSQWKKDGNVTLYTKWEANSYTVHFDANGGSGTMDDQDFTYDVAQNLTANAFYKIGYAFAGWATSAGGTVAYANGAEASNLTPTADDTFTLYAKWTADVKTFTGAATGAESYEWNNATNWSGGVVPTDDYSEVHLQHGVLIQDGESYHVGKIIIDEDLASVELFGGGVLEVAGTITKTGGVATEPSNIILSSTGSKQSALILDNSAGNTKAKVDLFTSASYDPTNLSGASFQYVAVPMSSVDVANSFSGQGVYTYVWTEAKGWERRGYYTSIFAFEALGVTSKDGIGFHTSGTLASTANISHTLKYTADAVYGEEDISGMNMFGNSWTAPVKIAACEITGSSDGAIHIYESGVWRGYPTESAGENVIPSMQAYCVLATSGGGTLTINYDAAVRSVPTANRTAALRAPKHVTAGENDHITLYVSDGNRQTDLRLYEGEQFTDDIDCGWEAMYIEGDGTLGELYAQATEKMNVLASPDLEGTIVGFVPGEAASYTISFSGDGEGYYLNDIKMEESTLITEGNTYDFSPGEGDNSARFVISRTPIHKVPTGVDAISDGSKARKQLINGILYVIRDGKIYDTCGNAVK